MKKKTRKPIVLLVDDYPDAREMYAEYLEFSGYEIVQAGNGVEAIERAIDSRMLVLAGEKLKQEAERKKLEALAADGKQRPS